MFLHSITAISKPAPGTAEILAATYVDRAGEPVPVQLPKAFGEGFFAWQSRASIYTCPYGGPFGAQARAEWMRGWTAASEGCMRA